MSRRADGWNYAAGEEKTGKWERRDPLSRETSTCDRAARCSGTAHGLTCREIGQNTKQHKGDHIRSVVRVVHVLSGDRLLYNGRTRGKECSEHPEHLVKKARCCKHWAFALSVGR